MTATKLWYPHHIEKYRRKTGHLTIAEHGAYRLLMDAYWDRRGPLPADETRLRKLIRADKDEWEEVREAVLAFFTLTDDGWRHDKIEENLSEAERLHAEKSERLALAREAKRLKSEQAKALSTEQSTDQTAATNTPSQSHSSKEEPKGARKRATRLAEDWNLPEEWLRYGTEGGLTKAECELLAAEMLSWSLTKKNGTSLDWKRTWQTWCRRHKSWGVKIALAEIAPRETIWPEDPEAAEKAQALQRRVGKRAYSSYFEKLPPKKNCEGWVVSAPNNFAVDRIDNQFGAALNDIYGRKNWRIEVAA